MLHTALHVIQLTGSVSDVCACFLTIRRTSCLSPRHAVLLPTLQTSLLSCALAAAGAGDRCCYSSFCCYPSKEAAAAVLTVVLPPPPGPPAAAAPAQLTSQSLSVANFLLGCFSSICARSCL